ncbi:MAG: hypothetical protein NZ519_13135 [Bacteroidia bacterium]|nr:hypothetical protein [Bacteroidia bacterium]
MPRKRFDSAWGKGEFMGVSLAYSIVFHIEGIDIQFEDFSHEFIASAGGYLAVETYRTFLKEFDAEKSYELSTEVVSDFLIDKLCDLKYEYLRGSYNDLVESIKNQVFSYYDKI